MSELRYYEVRGTFFTAIVGVDEDNTIVIAAPVLRAFRGKKLFVLRKWKEVKGMVVVKERGESAASPPLL